VIIQPDPRGQTRKGAALKTKLIAFGCGLSLLSACAGDHAGSADHAQSSSPVATTAALPPSAPSATVSAATPTASAALSAAAPAKSRIATEWSETTQTTVFQPRDVTVGLLSSSGWVDPTTEDFNDKRVGGFPLTTQWGAPRTADFASKLAAILRDDASYEFDVVTRCLPAKGVIGFVFQHEPKCGPKEHCALDMVNVVMNFPCHQVFVTTRVSGAGGQRGKTWAAHFGPAKDKVLDLLAEGFPDRAMLLKTLR